VAENIDDLLHQYDSSDWSVRLVRGVCAVVPFAPDVPETWSMVEMLKESDPDAKRAVLDAAQAHVQGEASQRALWMTRAMDTADTGIGVYSGLASAIKLANAAEGEKLDALETDPQQAADAVLKALAIAFVIYKLFPGGPLEKVAAFRKTDAGQAILFYYAAIEVGLPFADNALLGGGTLISSLFEKFGPEQQAKLAVVTGDEEAEQAAGVLAKLVAPLDSLAKLASSHLTPLAKAATSHMPGVLDAGDKAAGVAATGADLLPVYKFLGTRLVAEAAIRSAIEAAGDEQDRRESINPGLVPVKYTTSQADDLPDAPARKRSCLPFMVLLLAAGAGTMAGLLRLLSGVLA